MGDLRFGSVDLDAGRRWFSAAKEGRDLVTVAERNGAVATLAALMDVLADPQTVLPRGGAAEAVSLGELNLPAMRYRGEDAAVRGRDVPVVGAIPPPSWWRSGGVAPSNLPAWVRTTDGERRSLWGACAWVLERLAREGQRNPQQGTGANPTSGNLVLVGVVAVAGLAAWAYVARGAAGDLVREVSATHRFAEQAASVVKLYADRLRVAAATGTMPPPSPAETALNPAASPTATRDNPTPRQVGDSWWSKLDGDAVAVGVGAGAVALLVALAAWASKKLRSEGNPAPMAPQMYAGARPPQSAMAPMTGGR